MAGVVKRTIKPAVKAVVEDTYHQAGEDTPVSRTGIPLTPHTTSHTTSHTPTLGDRLCQCGMDLARKPHLCLKWNPRMNTPEAKGALTKVVTEAGVRIGMEPTVSVDLTSPMTIAYIRGLISPGVEDPKRHIVVMDEAAVATLNNLHNDAGDRFTFTVEGPHADPAVAFMVRDARQFPHEIVSTFTVTREPDPAWVRAFAAQHQERVTAMPICCANPDPRISKSNRPYCHSCKKYLDKVPPPQLPRPVPAETEKVT